MDRGAWQATVHRATESDMTERTRAHTHTHTHVSNAKVARPPDFNVTSGALNSRSDFFPRRDSGTEAVQDWEVRDAAPAGVPTGVWAGPFSLRSAERLSNQDTQ